MPPCPHTTIAASERGKLEHCAAGDCLRLQFGNAVLELDREEFDAVLTIVIARDQHAAPDGADSAEHALIDIGGTGASFAFTRDEIAELRELLTRAVLILSSKRTEWAIRHSQSAPSLHLH